MNTWAKFGLSASGFGDFFNFQMENFEGQIFWVIGAYYSSILISTISFNLISFSSDYGYVMDIGLQGVQAFLPKKKMEKYVKEFLAGEYPTVGQLVPCVVTQMNGQAAKLSAELSKLRSNVTQVNAAIFQCIAYLKKSLIKDG
jgi:hypothetical protein